MNKDRQFLIDLIKQWAADHTSDWIISDPIENGVATTSSHLTWAIQNHDVSLNLPDLLNRLEFFVMNRKTRSIDGLNCIKCSTWTEFAEANQSDGTFVCFLCRQNPYR